MFLNNSLGYVFYLLLRNDWLWPFLPSYEKEQILRDNYIHNNERDDYANPEKYKQGESFYSDQNPAATYVGKWLQEALIEQKPHRVLEIGPGSGFYTKLILGVDSVKDYVAIDINGHFLEFIEPGLREWSEKENGRIYRTVNQRIEDYPGDQFDAIILMSTIHHVPDREKLFKILANNLRKGGKLYSEDPTHYFPRILELLHKLKTDYLPNKVWKRRGMLATHHFCTYGEFKNLCWKIETIGISKIHFVCKNVALRDRLQKWMFSKKLAERYASKQVLTEFIKK